MLIKWTKNEFQKFLQGTTLKIKKRVLWRWRVPILCYIWAKFRLNRVTGLEIVGRGAKYYTSLTNTKTNTYRCLFCVFFFSAKNQKQD